MSAPAPSKRSQQVGTELARRLFAKKAERYGRRPVEIHLSETKLAALLAIAAEQGARQ